jgi:hypothetical protein
MAAVAVTTVTVPVLPWRRLVHLKEHIPKPQLLTVARVVVFNEVVVVLRWVVSFRKTKKQGKVRQL